VNSPFAPSEAPFCRAQLALSTIKRLFQYTTVFLAVGIGNRIAAPALKLGRPLVIVGREVGSAEKNGLPSGVRNAVNGHPPCPVMALTEPDSGYRHPVARRDQPFTAMKALIHDLCVSRIVVRFAIHDVAPVHHTAPRPQDWFVLELRGKRSLFAPLAPLNGLMQAERR